MPETQPSLFRSEGHKERFLEAIETIGKVYNGTLDEEYGSALFLLTARASIWERACGYVSRDGIRFAAMRKSAYFSTSEAVMVQLAGNLFNGRTHVDPVELMCLDEANFIVAIRALQLRRTRVPLEALIGERQVRG